MQQREGDLHRERQAGEEELQRQMEQLQSDLRQQVKTSHLTFFCSTRCTIDLRSTPFNPNNLTISPRTLIWP